MIASSFFHFSLLATRHFLLPLATSPRTITPICERIYDSLRIPIAKETVEAKKRKSRITGGSLEGPCPVSALISA
jgi:hypothetical protein